MIESLPRREREVFETLCRLQCGTTSAVRTAMGGSLSDSAVRTLLARLETKGLVAREQNPDGVLYRPSPRPEAIAASALRRTVDTFFAGSAASAATALLGLTQKLKPEELEALERAIDEARERGS
ncbi:BlaI/MecI/CopY family transcriptional regulator [Roseibacterium beibuensis]|uniref:BlaI/MecI/CopY family transcriptional regulator n=1 Tax=[Roseibacterium] beibuensis TaxID=1193142 RepID=UPI00217D8D41|nr:BlaI/MecI/CopY family transcriptional regulator [Roseibacterium beibuensis]MCS6627138.1 BlaI/MecI/CopY family transcriptional regulator [Roseibacterium beibuensis]